MSTPAIRWAWKQLLPQSRKLVLLCLASHSNAWPSVKQLSRMTGLGARTVQRSIIALVQAGLIEREERTADDGAHMACRYFLMIPEGQE
jgi:predicted transcriptional regulator